MSLADQIIEQFQNDERFKEIFDENSDLNDSALHICATTIMLSYVFPEREMETLRPVLTKMTEEAYGEQTESLKKKVDYILEHFDILIALNLVHQQGDNHEHRTN